MTGIPLPPVPLGGDDDSRPDDEEGLTSIEADRAAASGEDVDPEYEPEPSSIDADIARSFGEEDTED